MVSLGKYNKIHRFFLNLEEKNIGTIIWCTGFGYDFDSWIKADVFDEQGYPRYFRGVTDAPGLYFLGLPWMYTWGSGRFSGIARDAYYLMHRIKEKARPEYNPASKTV